MQQLLLLSGPCGPLSKDGEFSELLIFLVSFICHLGPERRLALQEDPKGERLWVVDVNMILCIITFLFLQIL